MLISVCIPVYNGENCLEKCLQSLCDQTQSKFEVIIQDDASTDKSKKIIEKFHELPIFYQKNETNLGMIRNWNKCIKRANGQIISFLHQV